LFSVVSVQEKRRALSPKAIRIFFMLLNTAKGMP